jgi:hypothetical protein
MNSIDGQTLPISTEHVNMPTQVGFYRRVLNSITILVFIVGLILPTWRMFTTPDEEISTLEQRPLAQEPDWERLPGQSIADITQQIEAWVNDQFGYRADLTYAYRYLQAVVLGVSPHHEVLIGEDGWLFYNVRNRIADYQGLATLPPEETRAWQFYQRKKEWLAAWGLDYVLVITPDKESIYPEYFPDYEVIHPNNKLIDQFVAYMRENTDVMVIDLRQPLLDYKATSDELLFYKTDTHWNQIGSLVGYRYLIDQLQATYPDLQLLDVDDFDRVNIPNRPGDMARFFLGLPNYFFDADTTNLVLREACDVEVEDKNPFFRQYFHYRCQNSPSQTTAVVFHHSFFIPVRKYFKESFRETIMINQAFYPSRYQAEVLALAELIDANLVIEELVERAIILPHEVAMRETPYTLYPTDSEQTSSSK